MATSYLPDPATRLHGVWIHRTLCVRRGARAVRTWVTETIGGWGLEIMGMVGRGGVGLAAEQNSAQDKDGDNRMDCCVQHVASSQAQVNSVT